MSFGTRRQTEPIVLPLQSAAFCLDCEIISNRHSHECLVCGSRSLVSLARMLGGNLFRRDHKRLPEGACAHFDATITLELHEITAADLNRAVDEMVRVTSSTLGDGAASLHVDVEPCASTFVDVPRAA